MKTNRFHRILLFFFLLPLAAEAQRPNVLDRIGNRVQGIGGQSGGGGSDSIRHRNRFEDTLTVVAYFLDSTFGQVLDTTVSDFTRRYPIPATHVYLGNTGSATRSILFAPSPRAGFDPGGIL